MKHPEILWPALRQYRHNNSDGFVMGYAVEEINTIVKNLLYEIETLKEELDSAESAVNDLMDQGQWISVSDQLPESQRKVLAYYKNGHGKGRIVVAFHISAFTVQGCDFYDWGRDFELDYKDGEEEGYVQEGWHEAIENWDDYSSACVYEGVVTHWMPLPEEPGLDRVDGYEN